MSGFGLPFIDPDVRVLVVDDETDLAELTAIWVREKWPCEITTSAPKALDILHEGFDLALLDRRLPGMSGDELLLEIRDSLADLQVIMVSSVDPDLVIIEMPFDNYLPKPIDQNGLQGAIEKLLVRRTYPTEAQEYFAAVSKIEVLEETNPYGYLIDDDRYINLRNHAENIRQESGVRLGDLSPIESEMYDVEADD